MKNKAEIENPLILRIEKKLQGILDDEKRKLDAQTKLEIEQSIYWLREIEKTNKEEIRRASMKAFFAGRP